MYFCTKNMQEASQHIIVNFNKTPLQNRSYSILHNFFFSQIAFKQKALLFFNLETVEEKKKKSIFSAIPAEQKKSMYLSPKPQC